MDFRIVDGKIEAVEMAERVIESYDLKTLDRRIAHLDRIISQWDDHIQERRAALEERRRHLDELRTRLQASEDGRGSNKR